MELLELGKLLAVNFSLHFFYLVKTLLSSSSWFSCNGWCTLFKKDGIIININGKGSQSIQLPHVTYWQPW